MNITGTAIVPAAELVKLQPDVQKLYIDPAIIRVNIGYPLDHSDQHVDEIIDQIIVESQHRMEINSGYQIFPDIQKNPENHSLSLAGKQLNIERIIYAQIKKSRSLAIFLCTIGPGMENWSRKLIDNGDYLKGYIVDAVASEAVEQATELTHNHLEAQMQNKSLGITNRFSPGYCKWSVMEQHTLFSLLPSGFCGISLTETALMLPIKSVSGIIGIGPEVKRQVYACNLCDEKNCIYRKKNLIP